VIITAAAAAAAGRPVRIGAEGEERDSHRIAVRSLILLLLHMHALCLYIFIYYTLYVCSVGGGGGGGGRRGRRRLRCSRQQQLNANETSNIQGGNDCRERSTSSPLYGRRKKTYTQTTLYNK